MWAMVYIILQTEKMKKPKVVILNITHGDKPYKNIKQTVDDRKAKQDIVWTRMVRFNQLGVSG